MGFDANRADLCIGVIGTGAMGRGIVQVAAAGGMHVLMMDTRAGAADEEREFVAKMLGRWPPSLAMRQKSSGKASNLWELSPALDIFPPDHPNLIGQSVPALLDDDNALSSGRRMRQG